MDTEDDKGPNHNPRNRPNIEGKEHEHDSIRRSSRITREPRSRTSTKPKIQWNENMKLALAYIVETEKKGRRWMRRVEKKWKDSFPMYDMLNMKNLRDMHAKLSDTTKSQVLNENFNLQTRIDLELCEYEKCNRTNIQSTSDCNENISVEHQAEITTQETNEFISGDCLEWNEEEEKLFARTLCWTNEPVTSRKHYYFKNKPTTKDINIMNKQVEHILVHKKRLEPLGVKLFMVCSTGVNCKINEDRVFTKEKQLSL